MTSKFLFKKGDKVRFISAGRGGKTERVGKIESSVSQEVTGRIPVIADGKTFMPYVTQVFAVAA